MQIAKTFSFSAKLEAGLLPRWPDFTKDIPTTTELEENDMRMMQKKGVS